MSDSGIVNPNEIGRDPDGVTNAANETAKAAESRAVSRADLAGPKAPPGSGWSSIKGPTLPIQTISAKGKMIIVIGVIVVGGLIGYGMTRPSNPTSTSQTAASANGPVQIAPVNESDNETIPNWEQHAPNSLSVANQGDVPPGQAANSQATNHAGSGQDVWSNIAGGGAAPDLGSSPAPDYSQYATGPNTSDNGYTMSPTGSSTTGDTTNVQPAPVPAVVHTAEPINTQAYSAPIAVQSANVPSTSTAPVSTGAVGSGPPGLTIPGGGQNPEPQPSSADGGAPDQPVSSSSDMSSNQDYLASRRTRPISPFEVQAGSVLPAVMVTSIDSSKPGIIIGQIREDVYDSASGRFLLIPKGSKLIGSTSSMATYGESRVYIAWQRLIFPDGSFIDLLGMQGAGASGSTGLSANVNSHQGKAFGSALLYSIFDGLTSFLRPRQNVTIVNTAGAAGMAQAQSDGTSVMQQYGQRMVDKNANVPPTLTVHTGKRFSVIVDKDMVLPGPYEGR